MGSSEQEFEIVPQVAIPGNNPQSFTSFEANAKSGLASDLSLWRWAAAFAVFGCLVFSLFFATPALAQQQPAQGWAGIVPGSNNWSVAVPYANPHDACASEQNSFVPALNKQIYGLISDSSYPDSNNPYTGVVVPAHSCLFDDGAGGTGRTISLFGCSAAGTKYVQGACLPASYPVTAEPVCSGCKGSKGQFPTVGDPVSVSSGAKSEIVTDYISGGPFPIEIKRYYRSMFMPKSAYDANIGIGLGWRINVLGRKVRNEGNSVNYNAVITRETGEESRFINTSSVGGSTGTYGAWTAATIGSYQNTSGQTYHYAQNDATDKFVYATNGRYEYTDENDRVDSIGTSFRGNPQCLIQTTWKGGYSRTYSYIANDPIVCGHIASISDSLGRTITIAWNGDLISTIGLPDGTSLQYSYQALTDGLGQPIPGTEVLTQVARYKAGGTLIDTTGYQYDRSKATTTVPLLTGVVDAKGVTVDSTTYDASGRVLTAQGPNGAGAVSLAYDDSTNSRTVTNVLGQVGVYTMVGGTSANANVAPIFKLTSISRQASATVPAGTFSQLKDSAGFLASRTDWNGKVTNYTNDSNGNETLRVEDVGSLARTYTTTWSTAFRVPTKIVGPNLTIDFTYDTAGNLTLRKETDTINTRSPVSRSWTYTWNSLGQLLTVTGPRTDITQTTTYTYDPSGNLATVKDALNRVTTVNTVNASSLPTQITDPNGVVTLMTYDPLGRIASTSVQGPTAATTSFAYDVNGLLTSITAPNGAALTYGYDNAHRLTSIADSLGNKTVFALDGLGNRTQSQVQTGSAQVLMNNSATFDSLGRLLTSIGAASQTTSNQYDNNGNVTKLTDPRSAVTQTAFDGLNRVSQVTDALNGVTKMAYDLRDNVTSVTDAKLHATTYTVNGFGFVTQAVSPDSGTTSFTYDLAGNVKSRTDGRKIVTNYTYDALDRPLTRAYPSNAALNVSFGYDATAVGNLGIGRLTSLTDEAGTASFVYDAYGNRASEKRTIAAIVYNTGYGYDLAGNVTKITYPSGFIVNYQRDALGRISGVTTQANSSAAQVALASSIGYLPFGTMQSATLGNGVQVTNSYDLDYRLAGIQAMGSATVQNLTLGYDGASNISAITDAVTANLSQTFQYDLLGRVTQGTGVYGTDNYTYDALGNRLTRSLVNGATTTTTYTYTAANTQLLKAVTGATTLNYAYDANGSRLTVKNGNTAQATYTYNPDARLATAGTPALKYNAFGQRSIETVTGGGTHFLFGEDGTLLAEHTTTGALARNYVYLNGKPLALVDNAGTVSYILNDQVGQPQKMLNASGTITWQRVAGIFGDTVSQPVGTTAANPLRFPGQQYDPNMGLHYNYFRDYDPATGRYLETDPIGLPGGINLYGYVQGNPINRVDPTGLAPTYPTPPNSIPGGPWQPAGAGQRPGTFFGPKQPSGQRPMCSYVPSESQGGMPGAKDPYYETIGPNGKQRYSLAGEPITVEQAHGQNQKPNSVATSNPLRWLSPLYIACFALGICDPAPAK